MPAPAMLSYFSPAAYFKDVPIVPNAPTVFNSPVSYSITPALPTGLVFNTTTGIISGTPIELAIEADYTITATNTFGSSNFILKLTVNTDPASNKDIFLERHTENEFDLGNVPNTLDQLNIASDGRPKRRARSKPNRVNLVPQEFNNLLEDQGVYVRVTPVILCPNRTDLGDTNHVLDCPLCRGEQVIEVTENAITDWALIQSITQDKKFEVQGLFDLKDARITFQAHIRVYYWYKVEVLHFSSIYNQIIKRASGNTDKSRYLPAQNISPPQNKTRDTPYICVDSSGNRYHLDIDYSVNGKVITWLTANRPAFDTLYSISYPVMPTFRILETIHDNRYYYIDHKQLDKVPVNLPQQAVIRWDYMAKLNQ